MTIDCSGTPIPVPSTPGRVGIPGPPVGSAGVDPTGLPAVEAAENRRTLTYRGCGCGVMLGEECDCAAFAAEAEALFRNPLFLDLRTRRAAS